MNMLNKLGNAMDTIRHKADKLYIGAAITMSSLLTPAFSAFADQTTTTTTTTTGTTNGLDVSKAQKTIIDMINSLLNPILALVGAVGALYCVLLGVKYAKAEEPQDREKAKAHLKSAIIGFVLIFVLIVALRLLLPSFQTWMEKNAPAA